MGEYLERMGDQWEAVLAPKVRRDGRVLVAGPEGAGDAELGDLEAQSGGFGVAGGVPEFLEEQVRLYLDGDSARFAVLELRETEGPFAFPVFRFRPSTLATWDGANWTGWVEGFCGFVAAADGDAVLREALAECAWGHGIVALLRLAESDVARLRGREPIGRAELERLACQVEMVCVPAHDGEAQAVWVNKAE
jgi:hypothetical protein